MKCYDFKVILQLKPSLIQDSSRYSPLFPGIDYKLWLYANACVE